MVEDLLAARGIIVSHQTVRLWVEKFGRHVANEIRRRSAGKLGDKWNLDEVVISIGGKSTGCGGPLIRMALFSMCWCRAAVIPRQPNVLCESFSKARVKHPRVMITDKLRSYGAAKRDIMPGVEHRSHKGLNNRAEIHISRHDSEGAS